MIHMFIFFQIAPFVTLSEEETERRKKAEYQLYLEEEASVLRKLGVVKEEAVLEQTVAA